MSWTTGTQAECLAANTAVGSAFTGTAEAFAGPPGGSGYLPANFFLPTLGVGKSLLIKAYGVLSTTTGTNNLTIGVTLNTTQGTYSSSPAIGVTPATAITASVTNVPWELEVLATCTATGSSGAILGDGMFKCYPTSSTLVAARCSSSTANPNTAVTVSTESAYYIELAALWSAVSNSLTVYNVAVLGLN